MKEAVMISNKVSINVDAPETFKQVMKSKHAIEWKRSFDEEKASVNNMEVNKLVDAQQGRITLDTK